MKTLCFIVALLIAAITHGQNNHKISTFLSFQGNATLYDRTITNNVSGFGFGFQTIIHTKIWIKPTIEINGDFFAGTKEGYLSAAGEFIDGKSGVASIYIGPFFQPIEKVFLTTTFGPSFYNGKIYVGIRPSIGFYPSKKKRWFAKGSFTNIFQHDDISNENFGYVSFALGLKL